MRCAVQRGIKGGGKPRSKIPQEQAPSVSHRRVGDIVVAASAGTAHGHQRVPAKNHRALE
jgi:hypothetical protein